MKRILFTEEMLNDLLTGTIVKVDGVEIALQDIGYNRIFTRIHHALLEKELQVLKDLKEIVEMHDEGTYTSTIEKANKLLKNI